LIKCWEEWPLSDGYGGHAVRACDSARTAVEVALAFQPELLLLDLMMPDRDGVDALHQIRGMPSLEAVPVVFITATVDPVMLARARAQQPLAILEKPVDVLTLGSRLESMVRTP
jgi:CheY-like chemotaxis protein